MKSGLTGSIFVLATMSALVACASKGPANSPATGSASAQAPSAASAAAATPTSTTASARTASPAPAGLAAKSSKKLDLSGYRRVTKDGELYFCKREGYTGSRTQVKETCLTEARMRAVQEDAQEFTRDVQSQTGRGLQPDGNGAYPELSSPVTPR